MDKQIRLANKLVDVWDRPYRKISVTLLRCNMEKPRISYAQFRMFLRKKEDRKFQRIFYVNYKLDEVIYRLDVLNSVYDKGITNKPVCNVQ